MAIVGYARVSTVEQSLKQSLDVQLEKLKNAQCEKIFTDKKSGVTGDRPQYKACLEYLREGDTLVITKLDRLARSVLELSKLRKLFLTKGIHFKALDQNIDTTTPTGVLMFNMLAVIAEFERDLLRQRQTEGIAMAKQKGVKFGRKQKLTENEEAEIVSAYLKKTLSPPELAQRFHVSRRTIYNVLKKHNAKFED